MARAPFQVLGFPFRRSMPEAQFAIFRRADNDAWQGIAGGGENNESPLDAARRESLEEAGLPIHLALIKLDTISSIPVTAFADSPVWGEKVYVIPEYCFGIDAKEHLLRISSEHIESIWADYSTAVRMLRYDSNKTALWELNQRIQGYGPRNQTKHARTEDGKNWNPDHNQKS